MREFLEYFNWLMQNCKEATSMTEEVKRIYEMLEDQIREKPLLTDTGLEILAYLQQADDKGYKAKEIAEGMQVTSRKVSGAMRKLVTDGYVEKLGNHPVVYALTAKGKEFDIEEYKIQFMIHFD